MLTSSDLESYVSSIVHQEHKSYTVKAQAHISNQMRKEGTKQRKCLSPKMTARFPSFLYKIALFPHYNICNSSAKNEETESQVVVVSGRQSREDL